MSTVQHLGEVRKFYDNHPINEAQILEKLAADGRDGGDLSEDILCNYDQDHYGGTDATDVLAQLAGLTERDHVLDICCGLGGTSRYLAHTYRCRVTGVDLTESRVKGAERLTRMTGQADRVEYHCGNAMDLPFGDTRFDAAVSQESFCHIPDKDQLLRECARVLKPGGRLAFTDIATTETTTAATRQRLGQEMAMAGLCTIPEYSKRLEQAGFALKQADDVGPLWRDMLIERLAMYRSLKEQTVERFGNELFETWDSAYAFFVGQYKTGELSGIRVLATRL